MDSPYVIPATRDCGVFTALIRRKSTADQYFQIERLPDHGDGNIDHASDNYGERESMIYELNKV